MLNRRQAVTGVLASVGSSLAVSRGWAQTSVACSGQSRFIDVHCHIFNAGDLPVEGFLKKVVIRGSQELGGLFARYPDAFAILIHELTKLLQDRSPKPAEEIGFIEEIEQGRKSVPSAAQRQLDGREIVETLLDKIWDRDILYWRSFMAAEAIDNALNRLQELLITEAYPQFFCCGASRDDIDRVQRADLAVRLYASNKVIGRYIRWALLFTRHRFEMAEDLSRIHRGRVPLMTPALVDFSMWVEDEPKFALADQIEVMARISRRKNGPHVHGFVGFDPLRQAIHEKNRRPEADAPLKLVQRAVMEKGFIGIKLYPPMGFQPSGNAELGKKFPCYTPFTSQPENPLD